MRPLVRLSLHTVKFSFHWTRMNLITGSPGHTHTVTHDEDGQCQYCQFVIVCKVKRKSISMFGKDFCLLLNCFSQPCLNCPGSLDVIQPSSVPPAQCPRVTEAGQSASAPSTPAASESAVSTQTQSNLSSCRTVESPQKY